MNRAIDQMAGTVQPQEIESEQAVLGCMLLQADLTGRALETMRPTHFYQPEHAEIFKAIATLHDEHAPIDAVTVRGELKKAGKLDEIGGSEYLALLTEGAVLSPANLDYHRARVREAAGRRELIRLGSKCLERAYDVNNGPLHKAVSDTLDELLNLGRDTTESTTRGHRELVPDVLAAIDENRAAQREPVWSGYPDVDKYAGAFRGGELILVASRPGVGKTTLALNIARNIARAGRNVLVFSLEVSPEQFTENLMVRESGIPAFRIQAKVPNDEDMKKVTSAAARMNTWPGQVFVDGGEEMDVRYIGNISRRYCVEHDIGLVIIDYLQLLRCGRREARYIEVGDLTRALKMLARQLDVPIMALSQLNRQSESRTDHRPRNADLRESGSLEQDADMIMLLYRPELDEPEDQSLKGLAEIIVSKHRDGPCGMGRLRFEGCTFTFDTWESQ